MPPVIAYIATAAFVVKAATFIAVSFFAYLVSSMLAPKKGRPFDSNTRDRQVLLSSATVNQRYVMGRSVVSGVLAFRNSKNGLFYLVVVLAGHEVAKIGDIWFGDELLGALDASGTVTTGRFANLARIRKYVGTATQSADPDLIAAFPTLWTSAHRLLGLAYIVVTLTRNDDVYASGVPTPRAEVFGVLAEDLRDGVIRYTDNAALLLHWYLRTIRGVPAGEIAADSWTAAANIGDEWVALGLGPLSVASVSAANNTLTLAVASNAIEDGTRCQVTASGFPGGLVAVTNYYLIQVDKTTVMLAASLQDALLHVPIDLSTSGSGVAIVNLDQRRYTANGVYDTAQHARDIVTRLGGAMGNAQGCIPSQGVYKCYPGAFVASSRTLTISDLRAAVVVNPRVPSKDAYNSVKGTFIDPLADWQMRDYPAVKNAQYVIDDYNEASSADADFPFCLSEIRAQRLAKIELERHRQAITVQWPGKITCFAIAPGDRVTVVVDQLGWTAALAKTFRVEKWELSEDFGVNLTLAEDAAAIYAWNSGEATLTDPAPDTLLPKPWEVLAPTTLSLESGTDNLLLSSDGTVLSRIRVRWAYTLTHNAVGFEVSWRRVGEIEYSSMRVPLDSRGTYIPAVQDGAIYEVRVRAVTPVTSSTWLSDSHVVIGKTAPPANVAGFAHVFNSAGTLFSWSAITDADADLYEIRLGISYETGARIVQTRATEYQHGLIPAGAYNFWLKAIDTSGNSSSIATQRVVTSTAPAAPMLTSSIDAADYALSWAAVEATFPVTTYEVRYGASYATGAFVASVSATSVKRPVSWSGVRTFWVAAIDAAGTTGTTASIALNVSSPVMPAVSATFIGPDTWLQWTIPPATLPIEQYEVRYGSDFATGSTLGKIKGTGLRFKTDWSGSRSFFVAAIDTAGNVGTAGSAALTVIAPSAPSVSPRTVQHQFSLTWTDAAASLPVDRYEIRRGSVFASGDSLGFLTARVFSGFELIGGSYRYWVVGYDTAGNQGTESSANITVENPPGLVVYASVESVFGGTFSNASLYAGDVYFPHDATKTWHQKFVDGGWATIAAKTAAGYDMWLEPSTASGYYEESYDYGSALASANVIVNATTQTLDGAPAIACLISHKALSGDPWTNAPAAFNASIAVAARFFKVRISCTSAGDDDLASLDVLQFQITS